MAGIIQDLSNVITQIIIPEVNKGLIGICYALPREEYIHIGELKIFTGIKIFTADIAATSHGCSSVRND